MVLEMRAHQNKTNFLFRRKTAVVNAPSFVGGIIGVGMVCLGADFLN
jgi:hypothetical protein